MTFVAGAVPGSTIQDRTAGRRGRSDDRSPADRRQTHAQGTPEVTVYNGQIIVQYTSGPSANPCTMYTRGHGVQWSENITVHQLTVGKPIHKVHQRSWCTMLR